MSSETPRIAARTPANRRDGSLARTGQGAQPGSRPTPPVRDAMIVAGGAGTRLRPLTDTRPKPLVRFCGEPFLVGVLDRLAGIGVDRVLLVVGADTAPFAMLDAAARERGVELRLVPEPTPLDTAGGARSALAQVRGTFLVLNGDVLTDVDLAEVVARHQALGATASLVLTRVEDPSSFGVCVLDGERIVDFVEKPAPGALPGQDTVNAGTYVLEPDALAGFPEGRLSFERTVFPALVADGTLVAGLVRDAGWADLGTPERLLAGHRRVLDGALAWPVLERVPADRSGRRIATSALVDASARLDGPVLIAAGAKVAAGAVVGPHVVIGANSTIGAGAQVRASVIGADCALGEGVIAARSITGDDVRLGAGARLEEAVVGDGVEVAPDAVPAAGSRIGREDGGTAPASSGRPCASGCCGTKPGRVAQRAVPRG